MWWSVQGKALGTNATHTEKASPVPFDERSVNESLASPPKHDSDFAPTASYPVILVYTSVCSKIVAKLCNLKVFTCVMMILWLLVSGEQGTR